MVEVPVLIVSRPKVKASMADTDVTLLMQPVEVNHIPLLAGDLHVE